MINGGDDETGVGERFGGVVMTKKRTASAVRYDHEREPLCVNRAVPHARQHHFTNLHIIIRWFRARRPYCTGQCRALRICWRVD